MPKLINRLDASKVKRAMAPGYYADGGGLYLQVTTNGARSWIYRFMLNGAARYMGLGSLMTVGLAEARQAALEAASCTLQVSPYRSTQSPEHPETCR